MSEFDWSGLGAELKTISCLCLDVLIDAKSVDFQGQLGEVASRTSVKAGALKGLTRELITVFQEAMKDGWGIKELETHFLESLEIPNAAVEQIVSAWQRNRERISASLLAKTLKANRLIDLDWNFGVTASSNDVDQGRFRGVEGIAQYWWQLVSCGVVH